MKPFFRRYKAQVIKLCLLVSVGLVFSFQSASFKDTQIKYKKVKTAYDKYWQSLQALLKEKGVDPKNFEVLINSYKLEKQLEVWCRSKGADKYVLLKTIPICASSGGLGPKRKEGDGQVPEGFYEVSWFNPMSDYHLGLKINYPNASDRIKAKGRPGGDIMIHGNCVTIGCIPLKDDPIEELYVLCVEAKNNKHDIAVNIYPFRMEDQKYNSLASSKETENNIFWASLKSAYDHFQANHNMPKININKQGDYLVQK
jgi:murein L,D-transpeptidase YafK